MNNRLPSRDSAPSESIGEVTKPPLGPVPWLPPYGWLIDGRVVPAGGPHLFVLPTATLDELRAFWRDLKAAQ